MKGRIIPALAVICCIIASIIYAPAVSAAKYDTAHATLGKKVETVGLSYIAIGNSDKTNAVMRNGVDCWLLDNGKSDSKLNINFDSGFKDSKFTGSEYELSIRYYDHGKGYLKVYYDSLSYGVTTADTIYMDNTMQWKTAVIRLQDAVFEENVDGKYDLQLSIYARSTRTKTSSSSVAIKSIDVKKFEKKNAVYPVSSSDETGYAYEWYKDSKIVHNTFTNYLSDDVAANVTYRLIGYDYYKVFEKSETVQLKKGESKEVDIDFGEVKRCGIYRYEIDIESESPDIHSNMYMFDIAVLKTDPNGEANEDVYLNTHFGWYADAEKTDMGVSVLKKGNFAGLREGLYWAALYRTGVLSWADYTNRAIIDALQKYNLKITPQLAYAPVQITGHNWALPKGEKQLKEWQKYVRYLAELLKDSVDHWEVWNEPDISSFNVNNDPPEVYSDMFVAAAKVLHEVDPTAKVNGPSVTNMKSDYTFDWFKRALAAGMGEVADEMSIHAYSHNAPEEADMETIVSKYKELFATYGIEDPSIINTELGFTTADDYVGTEERKGYLNARSALYFKARDLTDIFEFYNFEKKGTVLTDREDQFGVVSGGYDECAVRGKFFVPTDSYVIMSAYNYVMANTVADGIYDSDDGNLFISKFKSRKFNSDIVSLYTINEPAEVTLNLGADKVTCYDYMGNENTVYGKNGVFTFTADEKPMYISGNISRVEILKNSALFSCSKTNGSIAKNDVNEYKIYQHTDGEYKVEVLLPSCAEVVSAGSFEDGTASVKIKNNAEIGDSFDISFNIISSDEKTVQSLGYTVTSHAVMEPSLTAQLRDGKNLNAWNSLLRINNLSSEKPVKGKLNFISPESFAQMGDIDIGVIPKSSSGELKVSLPDIIKKGRQTVEYSVTLDSGEEYRFSENFETALATYATVKPKIDGIIDDGEWNTDAVMYADSAEQVVQMYDWSGPQDLSGRSGVMWDEDNFYLFAEVTDDVFCQNNPPDKIWAGDGMQFGVSYNEGKFVAFGQKSMTFHEIGIALAADGPVAYRTISQDNYHSLGICEDANLAITRNGNKTTYEFSIPWNKLLKDGEQPAEGDEIGYSFIFNDDDGYGRRGWIQCGGGIAPVKNTGLFMQLKLIK